jgi:hypothetical protein
VPGLAAVPIEEIDADAFEARRQTYVRNLSGEWHKVKLGRMFVEMLNIVRLPSIRPSPRTRAAAFACTTFRRA